MHYLIVRWNDPKLMYDIIHYTHNYDDMCKMMEVYPESNGYVHLIDIRYLTEKSVNAHKILTMIRENRKKRESK